ncbi:MAG: PEP/pyruvate-binding domain-containing protein [Chloroflexi bacterium]|nr:PEP/pyruvate-binding domain-containing protein [Chloroflexota bacterium]
MSFDFANAPKVLRINLELSQYPILAPIIRARMREELFARGVIARVTFDNEVKAKAQRSQELEGLVNPLVEESAEVWDRRVQQTRDTLTDFYFAHNLAHELFQNIVQSVVAERNPNQKVFLTFNPELAPLDMVLAQAEQYEALPADERSQARHHLEEMIVVIIKTVVSDQLDFVHIAKEYFTVADLREVRRRKIGEGKIGGKAAGMLLAWKVLQRAGAEEGVDLSRIVIPESYYLGANVLYDFNLQNGFFFTVDQKYKSREEIDTDYPEVLRAYLNARFPDSITVRLREFLEAIGTRAVIVRSSSLLEDSFGRSFAGKYESLFCANQGTPEENLAALITAIKTVYASVLSPDALAYRRKMGLLDYDERMAVLLQPVQGARHGSLFFPTLAGVGYSRNPFRWNPQIRREDGFLRLVWGLGTRAVDRVGNDHPRMLALSHPFLRPEVSADEIRRNSQRFVDLLDLQSNEFDTRPVTDVFSADDPTLPYLVSVDKRDYIQQPFSDIRMLEPHELILTFDGLIKKTDFVPQMRALLKRLEKQYECPVDIEFTGDLITQGSGPPHVVIHLLQCRPTVSLETGRRVRLPTNIPNADKVFTTHRLVPQGIVSNVRYIVYVVPEKYSRLAKPTIKLEMARVIGRLNKRLEGESFILMGPGRWGSSNIDLGVPVGYADINSARVLVEVASPRGQGVPDVSYGTHFFQDLVEAHIYALPLFLDDPNTLFNRSFILGAPNALPILLPEDAAYAEYIQVVDVFQASDGRCLEIVMDEERSEALAYLKA